MEDSKPSQERPRNAERVIFNYEHFKKIRAVYNLEDNFIDSWLDFNLLHNGGGKGGDLMCCSPDHKFLLKELKDHDHKSLLSHSEVLCNHYLGGPTILCAILIHFQEPARNNKCYFVMANILPFHGSWHRRYDIKGCQDDKTLEVDGEHIPEVHKRIWLLHMWLGRRFWSKERLRYFECKKNARKIKIQVREKDRVKLSEAVERDVKFLKKCGLMDYSLLIGQRRIPIAEVKDANISSDSTGDLNIHDNGRVFVMEVEDDPEKVDLMYIGIIDFLQAWTTSKKIAKVIKVAERNKPTIAPPEYGDRFFKNFHASLYSDPEQTARIDNIINPTAQAHSPVVVSTSSTPQTMSISPPQQAQLSGSSPSGMFSFLNIFKSGVTDTSTKSEPEAPIAVRAGSVRSVSIAPLTAPKDDDPVIEDDLDAD